MKPASDIETAIDQHLEQVRHELAGLPPDEQRDILQALETHIHDAFADLSPNSPTIETLEAIIAEMDPPESYRIPPTTEKVISGRWKTFGIGFVTACVLMVGIPVACMALNKDQEPKRNVNRHSLVGEWISVDFVSSIDQFKPSQKSWKSDLYLKDMTLYADGTTHKPWWTWKNSVLHHDGDNSDAKLLVKTINGDDYLFMEWMSGDVLIRKQKPKYYVLKRRENSGILGSTIIEGGIGCGKFRVGMSRKELVSTLGEPDKGSTDKWLRWQQRHHIHCLLGEEGEARELRFGNGFPGTTAKGIRFGSTEQEAINAYGKPQHMDKKNDAKKLEWSDKGILVWLTPEHGVHQIVVFNPY